MRRRIPSSIWTATLLVGALAVVTGLAIDARNHLPKGGLGDGKANPTATRALKNSPLPKPKPRPSIPQIPANSGRGQRVVYSISQKRVWLITESRKVVRSFQVWPGTMTPASGEYKVSYKRERGTGSDGVAIEHAVYFGTAYAFSNASNGAAPSPNPGLQTGAIREHSSDGIALWDFTKMGMVVDVVS